MKVLQIAVPHLTRDDQVEMLMSDIRQWFIPGWAFSQAALDNAKIIDVPDHDEPQPTT